MENTHLFRSKIVSEQQMCEELLSVRVALVMLRKINELQANTAEKPRWLLRE